MILAIIEISFILIPILGASYLLIQGIRRGKIYLILFPLMFLIVLFFSVLLFVEVLWKIISGYFIFEDFSG